VWSPELKAWIEWRIAQATPEARLRGEIALFWNPTARNAPKRWAPDALEREWNKACAKVGVRGVPFQQGTRHTTLTALSQELPERVLRQFSRHRHPGSLDHYTRPRATVQGHHLFRVKRTPTFPHLPSGFLASRSNGGPGAEPPGLPGSSASAAGGRSRSLEIS